MSSAFTEIRHPARRLLASPGYSASALLTLTLGTGLSVGMYTVLNGVLLASLPYPGGERVVEIVSRNTEQNETDGDLHGLADHGRRRPALWISAAEGVRITAADVVRLLASAAPAWRASRVLPMAALRYE